MNRARVLEPKITEAHSLCPSLYCSKEDDVRYEMMKPRTVPSLCACEMNELIKIFQGNDDDEYLDI
jgi:hypothetical protein